MSSYMLVSVFISSQNATVSIRDAKQPQGCRPLVPFKVPSDPAETGNSYRSSTAFLLCLAYLCYHDLKAQV